MTMAASIDLIAIARALSDDDVDAAIALGLLVWDGDAAAVRDAGVTEADIARMQRIRDERLTALAARARHQARAARLARLADERRQRQRESVASDAAGKTALSGAAAAALARALAKAKR